MKWLGEINNLNKLITNWDELMISKPILYTHFRSQTCFYGADRTRFTHIFEHSRMNEVKEFLEDYSKVNLPDLHLQQSGEKEETILSDKQVAWINNKYKEDYDNGWC